MGKLDGKVAIVTGASRGIGKAVAIGFAKEGAYVAIAARTMEHFTCALAAELGAYNIAVNCYKPAQGVASEGFVFNLPPDYDKSRLIGPEKMVKAAIFLAQQDVKGVTGCVARDEELIQWYGLEGD